MLCDTLDAAQTPLKTNTRASCVEVMKFARNLKPWFGMEQVRHQPIPLSIYLYIPLSIYL